MIVSLQLRNDPILDFFFNRNHPEGGCFMTHIASAFTYIECLVTVVFGSDERCLNDVQVSACHCDWSISTERKKMI